MKHSKREMPLGRLSTKPKMPKTMTPACQSGPTAEQLWVDKCTIEGVFDKEIPCGFYVMIRRQFMTDKDRQNCLLWLKRPTLWALNYLDLLEYYVWWCKERFTKKQPHTTSRLIKAGIRKGTRGPACGLQPWNLPLYIYTVFQVPSYLQKWTLKLWQQSPLTTKVYTCIQNHTIITNVKISLVNDTRAPLPLKISLNWM